MEQPNRRFNPRRESVVDRGRACALAASRPSDAFALALTIPDGWYRCQSMTAIARVAPDALADRAFDQARAAATAGEDAYQQTAVLCETLHAAIDRGRPRLAREILTAILARAPTVEPLPSRAFALGWLWGVAALAGDAAMRRTVVQAVLSHCHPDRSWRAARLYRDIADRLARENPQSALGLVAAMPDGRTRVKIATRLSRRVGGTRPAAPVTPTARDRAQSRAPRARARRRRRCP